MNGVGVGGVHPAQPGIPHQSVQQHPGGQQQPPQPVGSRPPNPLQPSGPAHLGGQRLLHSVNGLGVPMPPSRPVTGPGRPGPSAPANMIGRPGVPQPPQQQPGVPLPPPAAPGQQQHPQTPQLGQPPASPQKDTWTTLFFEFTCLPISEQTAIMSAAGFPDRQPTSLVSEADRVCRVYFLHHHCYTIRFFF
jgi:hypothetical protein